MVDASQPGPATGGRAPAGRALALLAGVLLLGALAVGTLLPGLRRLVADSVVRIAYESEPLTLDPHAVHRVVEVDAEHRLQYRERERDELP